MRGAVGVACLLAACEPARRVEHTAPRPPDPSAMAAPPATDQGPPAMPAAPTVPRPAPRVDAGPPPPTVSFVSSEPIGGDGELDSTDLDPPLARLTPFLRMCDEHAAVGVPRLRGVLELRFVISRSGRASRIDVPRRPDAPNFAPCVTALVRRELFPPPRGRGSVEVLAIYRFTAP
ncbi:MAG: hypothetical protein U0325_03955 [Polyangiales bacterium]